MDTKAWAGKWLGRPSAGVPSLGLPDVLWFFGAISAVAAATSIVDHVPESHRDVWEFLVSLAFLAGFALCAWILTRRAGRLPGGLAAGMAAAMLPAAAYGFTQLVHAYPRSHSFNPFTSFNGAVFGIALATAAAGLVAYALTRVAVNLALAVTPILVAAQFLATAWHPNLDGRGTTAVVVGLALTVIGLALDTMKRRGEAFWMHLGGLASLTVGLGLNSVPSRSYDVWIAMLVVGTCLVGGSPFLRRRTWVAFGAVNLVFAFVWSQAAGARGAHAIVIGAVVTGTGLLLDAAHKHRTAWWLYLGGLLALLEGLIYLTVTDLTFNAVTFTTQTSDQWVPLLVIGAALLAGFVAVGRRIWVVYGVLFVWGASVASEYPVGGIRIDRTLIIACVVFAVGLVADLRRQRVTGLWLQLWGLQGIAGALIYLSAASSDREGHGWIPMLVVGTILLLGAPIAQRRLWIVFGGAGVAAVFGHYLYSHSGWFRYVLLAIGLIAFAGGLAADRARERRSEPSAGLS